jgi:hypothetical protein
LSESPQIFHIHHSLKKKVQNAIIAIDVDTWFDVRPRSVGALVALVGEGP